MSKIFTEAECEKIKPKSWRDLLPIHPAAELFPLMSADELKVLGADIKKHDLRSLVTVWQNERDEWVLLDGRNRLDAMELVGRQPVQWIRDGLLYVRYRGTDPYAYVISANIHRRHLSAKQKRDLIAKVVKATPEKSNRQIAETVKVDHKTVASVRAEKAATGEIPQLKKTVGKDGKARKPPTKDPAVIAAANRAEARSKTKGAASDALESTRSVGASRHTPEEERWHNSLGSCAGEAVALEALWTREFGVQWKTFAAAPEHLKLAHQAAQAWTTIAKQLEKRRDPSARDEFPDDDELARASASR